MIAAPKRLTNNSQRIIRIDIEYEISDQHTKLRNMAPNIMPKTYVIAGRRPDPVTTLS